MKTTQEIADDIVNGNLRDAQRAIFDASNPAVEALWVVEYLVDGGWNWARANRQLIRLMEES